MKLLLLTLCFLLSTAFSWHEAKTAKLSWDASTSEQDEEYADCEFHYDLWIKRGNYTKKVATTQNTTYTLPLLRNYASGVTVGVSARAVCGPNEYESDVSWSDDADAVDAENGTFKVRYPASRGVSFGAGVSMNCWVSI